MNNISLEPAWKRRGHDREPNKIVQFIYAVNDWFQDFSVLTSAITAGFGRMALITANLVILVGIIIMSSAHSLELLRMAGARNGLEWVGVIIWELMFIFSSIMLDKDFKNGEWKKLSWAWFGFGLGFAFVEVSNIMGMESNWIGRAIGFLTPILLLVTKGLLHHQFQKKQQPTEIITTVSTPTESEQQQQELEEPKIVATESIKQQPTEWTPTELPPVHQQQKPAATEQQKTITTALPTETKKAPRATTQPTTIKKKQKQQPKTTKSTEEETARVLAIAKQHSEATGKTPGRDKLVELAGCSGNRARIVLLMLKEQQEQQHNESVKTVATESEQQPPTEKTTDLQQPKLELVQ